MAAAKAVMEVGLEIERTKAVKMEVERLDHADCLIVDLFFFEIRKMFSLSARKLVFKLSFIKLLYFST